MIVLETFACLIGAIALMVAWILVKDAIIESDSVGDDVWYGIALILLTMGVLSMVILFIKSFNL